MKVSKVINEKLNESYFEIDHPSGLKIMVMPKEDYSSTYAVFGTNYGSIDTCFKRSDESELTKIPEGTAHFLEHKLFESEDLDAFERYAQTGASANAYTSFDRTCYLFSCSSNLKESLEILLDFVQNPYFTEETVEKEQGIIGQEIRMYQDVPGWQVLFNLLKAMYHNHPVKIDIAGTIESIAKIDAEILHKCYNTFYNLNNMVLCVVGKTDVQEVLEIADRLLKTAPNVKIDRVFEDEPDSIVTNYVEQKLSVALPLFNLGFKEKCDKSLRTLKQRLSTEVLLEILAGETSPLYTDLLEKGLVNTRFGFEYLNGLGYASVIFSGESVDPKAVVKAIREEIERLRKEGIDERVFNRIRKMLYGRTVMGYNDIAALANGLVAAHFSDENIFDEIELFKNLTVRDIENRLSEQLDFAQSALSVILPVE